MVRRGWASIVLAAVLAWPCGALQAQPQPSPDERTWLYNVVTGDSLIRISYEYLRPGLAWQRLQQLNRVSDPYRLLPGTRLCIPVAWLRADASVAEVVHVQGDARVARGGTAAVGAAVGQQLNAGDQVLTGGEPSSLTLRLADGTRLMVIPGSRVLIEQLLMRGRSGAVDTRLRIEQGGADSRVPAVPGHAPRYRIDTPAMNLGVRGTEFRVRTGEPGGGTRLEVLDGAVAAEAQRKQARVVPAGFGTVADVAGSIGTPQALMAAPELGAEPRRLERVPLRLSWPPVAGASGYRAQVVAEGTVDHLLLDGRFAEPAARWADLPDGRYVFRVRAADAQGLEGRDSSVVLVLKARPEPPFAAEPRADSVIHDEQVTFRWARSPLAAHYRLQVSTTADFSAPVVDLDGLTAPEQVLPLPLGRYHWRLASVAPGPDPGPWGDAQMFSRLAKPAPAPPSPTSAPPAVEPRGLVFRWQASAGASYQYQIARDAQFEQIVRDDRTTGAEAVMTDPAAGTYYLRVRTIDADGFVGPFGGWQQLDVPRRFQAWLLLLLLPLLAL